MSTVTAAERDASDQPRKNWLAAMRLPNDYPLGPVSAFLLLVSCLVVLRSELPDGSLSELHWVLAIAAIPLLPKFLPLLAQNVKHFRAGLLELELRDFAPEQIVPGVTDIDNVAEVLRGVSIEHMPKRSEEIVKRVREIETEEAEIVTVNLGGAQWRLGSLYFFAFLLESWTIVRRVVFEEGGEGERSFVGMCSPRALRRAIERKHSVYRDVRKKTPLIDLDSSGDSFFHALGAELRGAAGEADHSPAMSPIRLVQLLRPAFDPQPIDRRELDGPAGIRRVLDAERRYVAVVEPGRYQVLDRYRVALAVARQATGA